MFLMLRRDIPVVLQFFYIYIYTRGGDPKETRNILWWAGPL